MKLKIYIILIFLGVILLFYSIWEIKPVVVGIENFLGLVSQLTLMYWIGYLLMILCYILLYFDKRIKNDVIYLAFLIVIGLFLFGVPIFAEENARYAWSYYPSGEVKTTLEAQKIEKVSEFALISYRSWPGSHFVSAFMISLVNVKIDDLIKYMPLFLIFSMIMIVYSAGKSLKISDYQCFSMSLLAILSFWTVNYYYGPQSLAYILYLSFFTLTILLYRIKSYVLIILTFVAIVMTHMLTSIISIISFLFSSRYIQLPHKNRIKFVVCFLIIFIGWHTYFATSMFEVVIKDLIEQITQKGSFGVFNTEKYNFGNNLIRQTIHYSRILYPVIYAIFMTVAAGFYLNGRIRKEHKDLVKICFFWLIGILTLLVFRYGAEIDDRVYIFSLLPMISIIVMTFDQRIIIALVVLLAILHTPAHYGTEFYDMVYTTELQGSKFLSSKIDNYDSINYYYGPLIQYYDLQFTNFWMKGFDKGIYDPDNESLEISTYIVHSKQINNYLIYIFGIDKIQVWIKDSKSNLLYDNGYYSIYKNKRR